MDVDFFYLRFFLNKEAKDQRVIVRFDFQESDSHLGVANGPSKTLGLTKF